MSLISLKASVFIFIYRSVKVYVLFADAIKKVTKRHDVELPYIQAVLKEWDLYCQLLEDRPIIKEIPFGGWDTNHFFQLSIYNN